MTEEIKKEEVVEQPTINYGDLLKSDEFRNSKEFIDFSNTFKGQVIETYSKEKLPELVNQRAEDVLRERENKTPEQLQMIELQKQIELLRTEKESETKGKLIQTNKSSALKSLTDSGLPTDFVDFFVSDNEQKTNDNVKLFTDSMEKYLQGIKQDGLKNNNVKVPSVDAVTQTGDQHGIPVPAGDNPKEWEAYHKKVMKFNKNKG